MKAIIISLLVASVMLAACGENSPEQAVSVSGAAESAMAESSLVSEPLGCLSLMQNRYANASITGAEIVAAGAFVSEIEIYPGWAPDYSYLPEFCRVSGSIQAVDEAGNAIEDSDIVFEAWLPIENWNGRFMQTGNGGAAGVILQATMAVPLSLGYAVFHTDTGHSSGGSDIFGWAVGHPEKLADYGWRAVHELTVAGKQLSTAYYGQEPEHSYFMGCSTGGRQGLLEAQRFPEDYDAIISGAPLNNWSANMALFVVIEANLGEGRLAVSKLGMLKQAALTSCDALDGVEDGVISAISQCKFDPGVLQCQAEETGQCLAAHEVAAARAIYAGVVDSSGKQWIAGTGPGSEPYWVGLIHPEFSFGSAFFQDVVLGDENWDPASFDADVHMPLANEVSKDLNATDSDLSAFFSRGGKLIIYNGTIDSLVPYANTVEYFDSVVDTLGQQTVDDNARLYLVPGMYHCEGGDGALVDDWLSVMERWVEDAEAPNVLRGTRPPLPEGSPGAENSVAFTRPVCPYPKEPQYDGNGDINDAASFSCVAP